MGYIEIYLHAPFDTEAEFANCEHLPRADVARNEIAECRIHLFEEIPWLARDAAWELSLPSGVRNRLGRIAIDPNSSPFSSRRFGDQAHFILCREWPWDGSE